MSVNLFDDVWKDGEERDGYASRERLVAEELGAKLWGGTLFELSPGERICPYHWHVGEEEWLLVVAGAPTLRTPDGERVLRAWDVAVFPRGPEGAHEVRNDGDARRARAHAVVVVRSRDVGLPGQRQGRRVGRLVAGRRRPGGTTKSSRGESRLLRR